jgi:hypothetical protein
VGEVARYNFPHHVALEAIREGLQATTMGRAKRKEDHMLGPLYTGAVDSTGGHV